MGFAPSIPAVQLIATELGYGIATWVLFVKIRRTQSICNALVIWDVCSDLVDHGLWISLPAGEGAGFLHYTGVREESSVFIHLWDTLRALKESPEGALTPRAPNYLA